MTLHEAIEQVLEQNDNGLTYAEIADIINEKKLYQKKDASMVMGGQIKIRVYNYQHLFKVENGKVFKYSIFHEQKHVFDQIVLDVISATTNHSMSVKQVIVPLFFFLKRILEADIKDYGIKIPIELTGVIDSSDFFTNSSENIDIKKNLISVVEDLSVVSYEINSIKTVVVEKLKELNADLIIDIFLTLHNYSFGSSTFSKDGFGILFNNLISDLNNSVTFSERNSSPDDINNIITRLYSDYGNIVLDPFAGSAGTLVKFNQNYRKHEIAGFEISFDAWLLGKMNLILNGISSMSFHNSNSLKITGLFKKQADLIITDVPFAGRLKKEEYDFETFVNTNDSTSIYLQYIIDTLKENGKAVVIVPQGFLFSNSTGAKGLKELMVESDWLDAVISLPQGIFMPYSGISSAVICIDLNKKDEKSFFFIDASNVEISQTRKRQKNSIEDNIDEIIRIFQSREIIHDSSLKINSSVVSLVEIRNQAYDFSHKRYVFNTSKEAQIALFGEEYADGLIELGDIIEKLPTPYSSSKLKPIKWLKGREMKTSLLDFQLTAEEIEEINSGISKNTSTVQSNALLITTHFNSLKPTYFIYDKEPILITNNINAFGIKEDIILPEYLIAQLYAPYFLMQLDKIRKGSSQVYFSIRDFLKLRIKVPQKDQQALFYEKAKQDFLEKKVSEVDQLTQELIKQKAVAINEQITIISSIQHELGNKLPALKNTIDDLKFFFTHQTAGNDTLSLDTKIRSILPGEDIAEVDSVNDIFKRVDNILNYTISMVDDAGGLINSDPSKFKPQKTVLVDYLKSEIEKFKTVHGNLSNIKFIVPADDGPTMNIDKKQFSIAINNIIQNAIRHGFTDSARNYYMVFQIIPDDFFDILIIKNDGKPFTEEMTIEKYKQPYQYAGKNGHSGLGGYLVNRVVENHNGSLDFVYGIDKADAFKIQFEIRIPKTIF
ncbi:hypothetical protein BH11BAC3_BH11BAC3_07430 [soil metagenome]